MTQKNYTIVKNVIDFDKLLKHLNSHNYFAFDTETTGLNVRKDKIIGASFCGKIGESYYVPTFYWNGSELLEFPDGLSRLKKCLDILKNKEIITFNGSFDVRVVKNNFGIDLRNNIIADAMLLKHTVEEEGDFSLKKIAIAIQDKIGLDVEEEANKEQIALKENVLKNGGTVTKDNFEMYKADLDIIGIYACADADLTLRVADYYNSILENVSFFYDEEVMPLYREVTIGMEDRGVKLDIPVIEQAYADINKKIEEYKSSVIGDLLNNPDFNSWLEDCCNTSFPVKPSGKFAQEFCAYLKLPLPFDGKKYSITKKTVKELSGVGLEFFSEGKCPPHIAKEIQLKLWKEKNDGEVININSKKQLGEFVFDYAKIKPLSTTAKGAPQFDDDFIEHLGTLDFPWAKTLSDYNKLIKIKSTYIERFLFNHENGFFYFSYKQHGTISGRYGSDAQQLPRVKEEGELSPDVLYFNNLIRSFFIAEEGRIFIDCDYESLEPHVFSHVSNDDGLRDIFRKGHDFYSTIAIKTEKMENVSADKKADNYLGKLAKPKRQSAKAYSLGVPYGMTDFALGKTLGISTQEAAILIDGYLSGFPELKEWMEVSRATVKAAGKIFSQAGRIRHLPKAKELFEKHGDRLLDFEYRRKLQWKLSNKHGKDEAKKMVENAYRDYKNSLNNSLNFQIQSLGASIINRAMIEISREFKRRGIDAWVCATVHDQAIFNVPEDKKEECAEFIKNIMENNYKLSVDLKAPPAFGKNWKESH